VEEIALEDKKQEEERKVNQVVAAKMAAAEQQERASEKGAATRKSLVAEAGVLEELQDEVDESEHVADVDDGRRGQAAGERAVVSDKASANVDDIMAADGDDESLRKCTLGGERAGARAQRKRILLQRKQSRSASAKKARRRVLLWRKRASGGLVGGRPPAHKALRTRPQSELARVPARLGWAANTCSLSSCGGSGLLRSGLSGGDPPNPPRGRRGRTGAGEVGPLPPSPPHPLPFPPRTQTRSSSWGRPRRATAATQATSVRWS
jgi:hypothetical protein